LTEEGFIVDAMPPFIGQGDLQHVRFNQHLPRRVIDLSDVPFDPRHVDRRVHDDDGLFRATVVLRFYLRDKCLSGPGN